VFEKYGLESYYTEIHGGWAQRFTEEKCLRNMGWRVITQRFTEDRHRDSQRRSN